MTRIIIVLLAIAVTGCRSPEAGRRRGGGPGADQGNRDAIVEMHKGDDPYHNTPCRMTDVECRD